ITASQRYAACIGIQDHPDLASGHFVLRADLGAVGGVALDEGVELRQFVGVVRGYAGAPGVLPSEDDDAYSKSEIHVHRRSAGFSAESLSSAMSASTRSAWQVWHVAR